jgi:hypothetical protein
MKPQVPSTKFQINLKSQYPMTKMVLGILESLFFVFWISNFGHCDLPFDDAQGGEPVEPFDICDLVLGILFILIHGI